MKRKFLKYVIPSVLAMWIYSLYTMVNGIFVARGVGELALAAVNISTPYINTIFAIAILFAVGTSTIASINLGNKEVEQARKIFTMNVAILILVSLTVTVTLFLNLERIAYFLGATDKTLVYVKEYLGIVSLFSVFTMLSYYFEVLVKTDGHPHLATIVVLISAFTCIFLDYLFVIKFKIGVRGAAYAVGISQVVACCVYVIHFIKGKYELKFVKFKFDFETLRRTIPIGLSDFISEFSTGFITFMFNRIILQNIGETGIVTYTVIMYVNTMVLMTMSGISQGTQPLVSYYYGRNDKKTYAYFLKMALKTVSFLSILIYAACMLFADDINSMFISRDKIELFNYSVKAFRIYVLTYLVVGFNIVFTGFYSAIEKPLYSMMVSTGRGLIIIAVSLAVMTAIFGGNGIWISSFVSEIICLAMVSIIYVKYFLNDSAKNIQVHSAVVSSYD